MNSNYTKQRRPWKLGEVGVFFVVVFVLGFFLFIYFNQLTVLLNQCYSPILIYSQINISEFTNFTNKRFNL